MWLWTLSSGLSSGELPDVDSTEDVAEDGEEKVAKGPKLSGFTLEYDAARKIAQGLGAHLEQLVNLARLSQFKRIFGFWAGEFLLFSRSVWAETGENRRGEDLASFLRH